MIKKSNNILLNKENINLLKKIIGNKVFTIYSDGTDYSNGIFISSYFSLLITNESKNPFKNSKNYVRVFSDYYLSEGNNYYKLELFNDKKPYKIETNNKGHLIYPFASIMPKGFMQPIKKIEVYQNNEDFGNEEFIFDCGILFITSKEYKYLICIHQSIRGGVEFIEDEHEVNKRIDQLELRIVLE